MEPGAALNGIHTQDKEEFGIRHGRTGCCLERFLSISREHHDKVAIQFCWPNLQILVYCSQGPENGFSSPVCQVPFYLLQLTMLNFFSRLLSLEFVLWVSALLQLKMCHLAEKKKKKKECSERRETKKTNMILQLNNTDLGQKGFLIITK